MDAWIFFQFLAVVNNVALNIHIPSPCADIYFQVSFKISWRGTVM